MKIMRYSYSFSAPYTIISDNEDNNENSNSRQELRALINNKCEINTIKHKRFYVIEVVLGRQNLKLKLSTSLQGIWVGDQRIIKNSYDKSKSKTYDFIQRYHSSKYGEGTILTDIFEIPQLNIHIQNFPFFLVDETTYSLNSYQGYMGIGFSFQDDSHSQTKAAFNFFDYLQSQQSLTSIIGFYSKTHDHGQIAFGDLPMEVKSNMKKYRTCPMVPIVGKPYYWPCVLDSIYFNDYKIYKVKEIVGFSLGASLITVDYDFLLFIKDNYFHYEFDDEICEFKGSKLIQIECKVSKFNPLTFPDISFIFGKMNIRLKGKDCFYEQNGLFKFIMISFETVKRWRIPPSILLGYYVFYDRMNAQLGFYKMDM